jgi:hypothetical protein
MSQWRSAIFVIIFPAAIIGLPLAVYFLLYDHSNEPFCHKVVMLGILNYFEDEKTNVLPNVDGQSSASMLTMHKYWGDQPWEDTYRYLPGLKNGDPGDLVLMYMPMPTRYIYHSNPQTIFAEPKWMIVPLDFNSAIGDQIGKPVPREIPSYGEQSERVSLAEFRARLKKTLDFLRENNRPNWQQVVKEHEAFLDSIKSD